MALYTQQTGLAPAFTETVNIGLQQIVDPAQGLLQQLLDGSAKALIIHWRGPLQPEAFGDDAEKGRGDGSVALVRPGDPLYRLPANVDQAALNIRMGVPLWVLGWEQQQPITLAMGLMYPLFASASLDVFSPQSGRHLARFYFADGRVPESKQNRDYMEWKSHCDTIELQELDVLLRPNPPEQAPRWPRPQGAC